MKFKILLIIFLLCFSSVTIFARNNTISQNVSEVIVIANRFIKSLDIKLDEYKLVEVKNLVISGNDYKGERYWKVTYKARNVIGSGKGGEIYIEVDFKEKIAKILGYGE